MQQIHKGEQSTRLSHMLDQLQLFCINEAIFMQTARCPTLHSHTYAHNTLHYDL